jgi:2-polyprenyl-6-methoxyphenol hydroxylase-like FAD-dependent oxidoreductase
MADPTVIIAGAGPVGLLAALKLARAGVSVTVVEALPAIPDAPRALGHQWPVPQLLDGVGVLEDALAMGVIKRANQFRRPDTRAVDVMSLAIFDTDAERRYDLHLGQHELAEIFLRHFNELPGTAVRWNSRVVGLSQDGTGVSLSVETGKGVEELHGDWLIGADGSHSAVRRSLELRFDGHTWPDRFVATNVYFDFGAHGFGPATFLRDPVNWAIVIKFTKDDMWRVAYGEDATLTEDEVRSRVHERFRSILPGGDPYEVKAIASYRVHERCAETFRVGRVLLAGDAAHICNPAGGLGLMGGLLDANALGWALISHLSGESGEEILDHYAHERRTIFREVTSPIASRNKQSLSESDPEKMRAVDEGLRRSCTDPKILRIAAAEPGRLAGTFPLK